VLGNPCNAKEELTVASRQICLLLLSSLTVTNALPQRRVFYRRAAEDKHESPFSRRDNSNGGALVAHAHIVGEMYGVDATMTFEDQGINGVNVTATVNGGLTNTTMVCPLSSLCVGRAVLRRKTEFRCCCDVSPFKD
jgi:hypothetical protein